MAKGFNKKESIDYNETFSLVVKLVTIHTIFFVLPQAMVG